MNVPSRFDITDSTITEERECETHGSYLSVQLFGCHWSQCPVCSKNEQDEYDRKREIYIQEEARNRWIGTLRISGIPERFRNRRLSTFVASTKKQKEALSFAIEFENDLNNANGRCAIFVGTPGTGKTHLAIGVGIERLKRENTVLFTTVFKAVRKVKESWSKDTRETESEIIESMVSPSLLILDEVGVQFGSDTEKIILFDILNDRYEKRKSTILISNLTINEVKSYLGERIFDRFREDNGGFVVFDWKSYRGNENSAKAQGSK